LIDKIKVKYPWYKRMADLFSKNPTIDLSAVMNSTTNLDLSILHSTQPDSASIMEAADDNDDVPSETAIPSSDPNLLSPGRINSFLAGEDNLFTGFASSEAEQYSGDSSEWNYNSQLFPTTQSGELDFDLSSESSFAYAGSESALDFLSAFTSTFSSQSTPTDPAPSSNSAATQPPTVPPAVQSTTSQQRRSSAQSRSPPSNSSPSPQPAPVATTSSSTARPKKRTFGDFIQGSISDLRAERELFRKQKSAERFAFAKLQLYERRDQRQFEREKMQHEKEIALLNIQARHGYFDNIHGQPQ
jgi:hypothetical protein